MARRGKNIMEVVNGLSSQIVLSILEALAYPTIPSPKRGL
jgi:hypothetical protein